MVVSRAVPEKADSRAPLAARIDGETALLLKIAAMPGTFRAMGERMHAVIMRSAPLLQPRVWYGMPGYTKDGKTICFFRADKKYMTFGLTQEANLSCERDAPDQLIASAWYFSGLDDATETALATIIRRIAT